MYFSLRYVHLFIAYTYFHSLSPRGSTYHFFFAVFMFYAAIKTTREQHNIIRYVLKILTKTELDALLWKPHWKSARRSSSFFVFSSTPSTFSDFYVCNSDTKYASNATLSLLLISIAQIYSNKDKFRRKNIIIYQFICFNLCLFSGSFCT